MFNLLIYKNLYIFNKNIQQIFYKIIDIFKTKRLYLRYK